MKITEDNYKDMLGHEFLFSSSKRQSSPFKAFIATAKIDVGYTVKDMNEKDPDKFLACLNCTIERKGVSTDFMLGEFQIICDMKDGDVYDYDKSTERFDSMYGRFERSSGVDCPF